MFMGKKGRRASETPTDSDFHEGFDPFLGAHDPTGEVLDHRFGDAAHPLATVFLRLRGRAHGSRCDELCADGD